MASAEKEREAIAAKKAMKQRRIESKALIKKIPTDPTALFSYAIDWGKIRSKLIREVELFDVSTRLANRKSVSASLKGTRRKDQ